MKGYQSYFDRQKLSPQAHRDLVELEEGRAVRSGPQRGGRVMKFAALAACAALVVGLGGRWLSSGPGVEPMPTPGAPEASQGAEGGDEEFWASAPGGTAAGQPAPDDEGAADFRFQGFTVAGPADGSKLIFPMIAGVDYADVTGQPEVSASLAYNPGSFTVDLTKEDIQKLFWGPEGKPAVDNPKTDPGDFPILLMNWAGYTITGEAIYDGNGDLWELRVWGEKGEDSFTLRCAPGHVPPTCVVEGGAVTTDVLGVEVSGWYRSYDNDGDDVVEHICTSEFIANGVGFRFENVGSGGMTAGTGEATALGCAKQFNQMVVTQLCHADGFYLDQFAHCDDIPDWEEEGFDTLAQAQSHACYGDFAHYLPTAGPQGYGEFYGHHSYQEGLYDRFWLRWTKGYDDVEVEAHLPEGGEVFPNPVDVAVPASYDWRLYDGSISDTVPQEYQADFYKPAFRAQDMSLEVVKARMNDKDTGGQSCRFWVLHAGGTVVGYDCSGVSAEYVWSLVEPTLSATTVELGTVTVTHHPDEHHDTAVPAEPSAEICSLPLAPESTHHSEEHHESHHD